MLQVNKSSQPVSTQIQTPTRPILTVPNPKPKGPSAQGTSFLRRRKIVQVLAARAEENYEKPAPKQKLVVFEDYPILEVEEDDTEYPQLSSHQQLMADPEHDECLVDEFLVNHGMLYGASMNELPEVFQGRVTSKDMY